MFKKIATTLAATALGVSSAQSWTDAAGLCPNFYEDGKQKFEAPTDIGYYPKNEKDDIDLDKIPSLHELVLEFDDKKPKGNKKVDDSMKCMYFVTQGGDETREVSERFCVDDKAKKSALEIDKKTKKAKGFPKNETIPLWNVKKIETQVVEEKGIVQMTFKMRFTNFSTSTGYYTDEDKNLASDSIADKQSKSELPQGEDKDYSIQNVIIANKHPEVLKWTSEEGWQWQAPSSKDFFSGDFLQKYFDYSMVRYNDTISVKIKQTETEDVVKPGCSIDILKGSTIKGARLFHDETSADFFFKNIAFRLQPIKEYYDQTRSYSQNGDQYTLGYDNDYMDGKVEYTANGYPPQSFQWKMSRSRSTTVVATALTIAGALIGSLTF